MFKRIFPILLLLLSGTALLAQAPQITTQPAAATVTEGQTAQFTVVASGGTLVYEWFRDGVSLVGNGGTRITGVNSQTLTIADARQSDAAKYSVVVSIAGSPALKATSDEVTLKVNPAAPQITTQPQGQTIIQGQSAQFSVVTVGSNLLFRWSKDGLELSDGGRVSGAATNTLNIGAVQSSDEGTYTVVATVSGHADLKVTSADARLKVTAAPADSAPARSGTITFSGTSAHGVAANVNVTPNGHDTTVKLDYGRTSAYGLSSSSVTVLANVSVADIPIQLAALAAHTTYYVRASALNSKGTVLSTGTLTF